MNAFAELRDFARDAIPTLLLKAGGEMSKHDIHAGVEQLFAGGRPWPEELNQVQRSGCSAGRNAIAWAIADLVQDGILCRSAAQSTVRLADLRPDPPRVRNVRPSREARIMERASKRARGCRARARKEGVPFDEAFVLSAPREIERQHFRCAATGIPFDLDIIGEGAGGSHYAPSPDRIVPARGYVPDNVRWVLWMVNRAKGRMTEKQFRVMCRAIAARS